jgi:hypothetical protein
MTYEEAVKYYSTPKKKTTPISLPATNPSGLPSQQYAKPLTNEQLDQAAATSGYNPTIVTNKPKATTPKFTAPVKPVAPSTSTATSNPGLALSTLTRALLNTGQLATQLQNQNQKEQQKQKEADIIYSVEQEDNNPAFGYNNTDYDSKSATDQIMDKYGALRESTLAGLKAAYDKTRAGLQGQIPLVNQNAQANISANDIGFYQSLPQIRAAAEQAGVYRGGDLLDQNVRLQATRSQNAADIGQDRSNQLYNIQQAIAQADAEQPLKEAEIMNALDAQSIQAALDQANIDTQNSLALSGLSGILPGGGSTLAAIAQAYEQSMGIADRTGNMPGGGTTLAAQQQAANQAQQEKDNAYRQAAFAESVRQFQANYGLNISQMTADQAQQAIDNAYRTGQLSIQQKNQALNEAQFAYQQKQDALPQTGNWQDYYDIGQQMKNNYQSSDAIRQWIYNLVINGELSEAGGETLEQSLGVTPGFGNTIKDTFNSLF